MSNVWYQCVELYDDVEKLFTFFSTFILTYYFNLNYWKLFQKHTCGYVYSFWQWQLLNDYKKGRVGNENLIIQPQDQHNVI